MSIKGLSFMIDLEAWGCSEIILLLVREEKQNFERRRVTSQKSWGEYTDHEHQKERWYVRYQRSRTR